MKSCQFYSRKPRRTFEGLYRVIMMIVKSVIYSPAYWQSEWPWPATSWVAFATKNITLTIWIENIYTARYLMSRRCNLPLIFNQETRRLHTLVLNIHMLCSLLIILLLFMVTLHLTLWYSFYVYAFLYALLSAKNAVL